MPNPVHATVTAASANAVVWLADFRISPFLVNVQVIVPNGTTASYEVDFTLDNPNSTLQNAPPVTWTPAINFPTGSTSTLTGQIAGPVHGLRLNVASISGGPIYFSILQSDSIT